MKIKSLIILGLALSANAFGAITLQSGFSSFKANDSGQILSNMGNQSLSLTLGEANVSADKSGITTGQTTGANNKTKVDISSLNLSTKTGFTINMQVNSVKNKVNNGSIFGLSTNTNDNAWILRTEGSNDGFVINGSSSGRPTTALTSVLDTTKEFNVTLSVENNQATVFLLQNGITTTLTWNQSVTESTAKELFLGSWGSLTGNKDSVDFAGISFYSGAATAADIPTMIQNYSIPEPSTATLGLLGLGGLLLRRRRVH